MLGDRDLRSTLQEAYLRKWYKLKLKDKESEGDEMPPVGGTVCAKAQRQGVPGVLERSGWTECSFEGMRESSDPHCVVSEAPQRVSASLCSGSAHPLPQELSPPLVMRTSRLALSGPLICPSENCTPHWKDSSPFPDVLCVLSRLAWLTWAFTGRAFPTLVVGLKGP